MQQHMQKPIETLKRSDNLKFSHEKMTKISYKNDKSIEDLIRDIDCIQETKENSAVIEYNWFIDDIIAKVSEKTSGEKIESDEFFYKKLLDENNQQKEVFNECEICRLSKETQDYCAECKLKALEMDSFLYHVDLDSIETKETIENQIIFDNFLTFSKWKLEIEPTIENLSIKSILVEPFNVNKFPEKLNQKLINRNIDISFTLKMNFYILNSSMDDVYCKKSLEQTICLNDFNFSENLLQFSLSKLCKIDELLTWLIQRRSKNFCVLTEFKIYYEKSLAKSFKHAWTINGWKNFLQFDSDYDQELKFQSQVFRLSLEDVNDKSQQIDIRKAEEKVEEILKQVKWKLQLYPKGYSAEFNDYLSLFLTFNEISNPLKQLADSSFIDINQFNNNSTSDFYDNQISISLLTQKPTQKNLTPNDSFSKTTRQQQQHETLVKACFQISIIDENGKKIDTCQSEKQLFELYGSWGYKEYLPVRDLIEMTQKYLIDGYRKLHLKCVITLYYITNVKYYPRYSDDMVNLMCKIMKNNINGFPSTSILKILDSKKNLIDNLKQNLDVRVSRNELFNYGNMLNSSSTSNSLSNDMSRLYKSSDMFDLIIQAPIHLEGDSNDTKKLKNFKVHKLILSLRSVVFEKMFNDNFKLITKTFKTEQKTMQVEVLQIIDFDAYTVDLFLKYLYTDTIDLNYDDFASCDEDSDLNKSNGSNDENSLQLYTCVLIELFKISDKYCVFKLRELCEYKLIRLINHQNLIQLLILAYLHNSSKLKQKCFSYLAKNVRDIIKQKNWTYLEDNYPSLLAEAFRMFYMK